MGKKIYITTTLPYLNSTPHVGHALEFVQADAIARFLKKKHLYNDDEVHLNVGVDEHGLKIYQAAQNEGKKTQEYCDGLVVVWKEFLKKFKIEPDSFWRTTSFEHKFGAKKLWELSLQKGDIYKKEYEGHYCVGCESFKLTKDLVDGKCPDHGNQEIKFVKESNYFFRLEKYKEHLVKWLDENEEFLTPVSKREELRNMILDAEDISISRLKSSVPWGVEVPGDPEQVMYVWFEALTNYISSCGYGFKRNSLFQEFWDNSIQLCGPDNLRFQGVIWQSLLASFGISQTKKLLVHGTILDSNGVKMSKSLGNVVDPIEQIEKYGLSAVRYYMLAGLSTYGNSNWDEEELVRLYNAHLANSFGNLINRVMTLMQKKNIPIKNGETDWEFNKTIDQQLEKYRNLFEKFEIKQALLVLNDITNLLNNYIAKKEPWKDYVGEQAESNVVVLRTLHWCVFLLCQEYQLILPEMEDKFKKVLFRGEKEILFPRIN